jgi:hypothetical protein
MLRLTLELVPRGDESAKRSLGTLEITNVAGNETMADYLCMLRRTDGSRHSQVGSAVSRYLRRYGAWRLALSALGRFEDYL